MIRRLSGSWFVEFMVRQAHHEGFSNPEPPILILSLPILILSLTKDD